MIAVFVYQIFVVWLAYDNAERIAQGKRIYHGLNGLLHLLAAAIVLVHGWQYSVALLFLTRIVFDSSLNLFRNLSLGYVTPKPKSIIDKVEQAIFGRNGYTPKIIYAIIVCLALVL